MLVFEIMMQVCVSGVENFTSTALRGLVKKPFLDKYRKTLLWSCMGLLLYGGGSVLADRMDTFL